MRRVLCTLAASAAFASTLFFALPSRAELVDSSAGIKVMAGGSLWSTPSDRPNDYDGIGYAGNGGGFSYGAGLYGEVRFIKVLSLEVDFVYDRSTLARNVDLNSNMKVQEKIEFTSWRIPVLLKGNLPTPFGRLFVLVGPEFVMGKKADPTLEVTEGGGTIQNEIRAEEASYTMFTGGLGLTIDLPFSLEVPLELRASKNLGQEEAWRDRVEIQRENGIDNYTVDAQTSWDFRFCAGVGYQF